MSSKDLEEGPLSDTSQEGKKGTTIHESYWLSTLLYIIDFFSLLIFVFESEFIPGTDNYLGYAGTIITGI